MISLSEIQIFANDLVGEVGSFRWLRVFPCAALGAPIPRSSIGDTCGRVLTKVAKGLAGESPATATPSDRRM